MRRNFLLLFFITLLAASGAQSASAGIAVTVRSIAPGFNQIEGTVWDTERHPVADLYIELSDAANGDLGRVRSSGSGRFTFFGLSTGRFIVKVLTTGTGYLEDSQDVEILGSAFPNSRETRYVDFILKLDPRKVSVTTGGPPEAIFVQEVPDDAKKLFKKGSKNIDKEPGLKMVEQAIDAFPSYFDALYAAGKESIDHGDFVKGARYLVRATDVNPRSYKSYSLIAYAAYKLNKIPEGILAARSALAIEPNALPTKILLGTLLRVGGQYHEAEEVLVAAKKAAPDSPKVHYELALVFNRENRNSDAASELETYLKLSPNAADKKEITELINKLKGAGNK
jgi:Tetratricopeptide repeat